MVGVKCYECGQMGFLAPDCPKRKPTVMQTLQANPEELFCTSCGNVRHLDVIYDQFSESVQEVWKKWDVYQKKLKQNMKEIKEVKEVPVETAKIKEQICLVRAQESKAGHCLV